MIASSIIGVGEGGFSGITPCFRRISFLQYKRLAWTYESRLEGITIQYPHSDRRWEHLLAYSYPFLFLYLFFFGLSFPLVDCCEVDWLQTLFWRGNQLKSKRSSGGSEPRHGQRHNVTSSASLHHIYSFCLPCFLFFFLFFSSFVL